MTASGLPEHDRVESHWSAFDAEGVRRLVSAEDRHFWFRARNETLAALAGAEIRALPDNFSILEVGCGSGNVLRVLQRLAGGRGHVEGLELSAEAAAVARERTGLRVTSGYLSDMDPTVQFDIIGAFDVLEHVADASALLMQIRERLHAGGRLLLTVPAHQGLWSSFDVASGHERRYSLKTLSQVLKASGYRVAYITYFMSLLYPPMWLRRRLWKTNDTNMGSLLDSEFQIVPGINELAYEALRQEARVVRARRRLPMGTSIAAIGIPTRR